MDPHAVPTEIPDYTSLLSDGPDTFSFSGTGLTIVWEPDGILTIDHGTTSFAVSREATKASDVDYTWAPDANESIISVATNLRELLSEATEDDDEGRRKRLEEAAKLFELMKARVEFGERMLAAITKGTQQKGTWTAEHTRLKDLVLKAARLEDVGGPLDLGTDEIDAFVRIAKVCSPPQTLELAEWKNIISLYKGATKSKL